MTRQLLLNLTLVSLTVGLCAGAAEIALRLFYPQADLHLVLAREQTVTLTPLEEFVPGVSNSARYQTSSWGIRGSEFDESDEYRILAIGGSTTQNAYLDQSKTWTLLTGTMLNQIESAPETWTGDIGRSGHTARSHALQLEYTVPELPGIDAVVMLVGVNDLTVALRQGFAYESPQPLSDPVARAQQMREAFLQVPGGLHNRLTNYQGEDVTAWKRTALYQLMRQVRDRLVQARGGTRQDRFGESYATWRTHRASAPRQLESLPDLARPLADYRTYLVDMAKTAKELGVRLVFVTQPVLWRADLPGEEEALLWLGGIGDFQTEPGHEYFTARALRTAMDRYNSEMMDVCIVERVECFDLARVLPSTTEVFYDDVHFTERGSEMVAERLVEFLSARPPYAN